VVLTVEQISIKPPPNYHNLLDLSILVIYRKVYNISGGECLALTINLARIDVGVGRWS